MRVLRRFRLMTVRFSLILTLVAAAIGFKFEREVGLGIAMGGIAGVLGFWLLASRMEKVAIVSPDKVKSCFQKWSLIKFAIYGATLWRAYSFDPERGYCMLGAVAGLFVVRVVMAFMGFTGLDLKKEDKAEWKKSAND